MEQFCKSLTQYNRRQTSEVHIGNVVIGGTQPIAVQSMTACNTLDTVEAVAQIRRIVERGGHIVRLTAQGRPEAENLRNITAEVKREGIDAVIVADIHFLTEAASIAADYVDKVRINPGNYKDENGEFAALIAKCRKRGVALRIGVNHGSLSKHIMEQYGDTTEGMVASAMEFLQKCRAEQFDNVVVSIKSSNTRVMVEAYRKMVAAMDSADMHYPLHIGVTEAGNDLEGRIKSAVGIGALLADGIGDTVRVSLTEPPENEIPVALALTEYFSNRETHKPIAPILKPELYSPFTYRRRSTEQVGRIGGTAVPVIYGELTATERELLESRVAVIDTVSGNTPAEWRSAVLNMEAAGDTRPAVLRKHYNDTDAETLAIKAAADFGMSLLDGLCDGIWIDAPQLPQQTIDETALDILQATRTRMSHTEYIACPGCGRTLYDLRSTLASIKAATADLVGLKIGVMGCIVNGPGEMADADYGYVGAGPGKITLYRAGEVVRRNIPEAEAIDALLELIKSDRQ